MRYTITIAIALLVILAGCAQTPAGKATTEQEIPIGAILILTGPGATWGTSSVSGAQMAIDEINANGGVNGKRLKLIAEDTAAEPKRAVDAYHKLRELDNAHFILGTTWTGEGLPLAPIAAADDVVMISPSLGVAQFNEAGDNIFNLWPHDALLSSKLAEQVFSEGHRKVAVFSTQQQWVKDQSDAFTNRFEELGGSVVLVEVPLNDKDQRTDAAKIIDADVDAVVITNTITGDVGARRLKELGWDKPMYSITMGADIIAASDGAMEGLHFLSSLTPTPEFERKFSSRYPGQVLDVGGDSSYDAVMLLAQAMRDTHSEDPSEIAQYIRSQQRYSGASGTLVFDGKGGVTKEFVEFEVRNGTAVRVD